MARFRGLLPFGTIYSSTFQYFKKQQFNLALCRYNVQIKDFVSKLPGINSKNIYAILNKADSLMDLLAMNEDTLGEILGSRQNGSELYSVLHGDIQIPDQEDGKAAAKKKPFKRFKSKK